MLATFIILYIVIRTQLRPQDAPLPADPVDYNPWGTALAPKILLSIGAAAAAILLIAGYSIREAWVPSILGNGFMDTVFTLLLIVLAAMVFTAKGQLFLAFLTVTAAGFGVDPFRPGALYFTLTGPEHDRGEPSSPTSCWACRITCPGSPGP